MKNKAKLAFVDAFSRAFIKRTVRAPSDWARQYRFIPDKRSKDIRPWTFKYAPWLQEMHDCEAPIVVGQKAAQMGYTETLLNKVFYEMDINNSSCLYVLPSKTPDATDFSVSRFDPAIEMSPYLQQMFSDVKNVGLKRAGAASLFIRGSRSKSGLKSVPCAFIALDEVEEMTQDNIPLVRERSSGQFDKLLWMISTPTVDDRGINKEFKLSTMDSYFFQCPHCSRHVDLTYPESVTNLDDPHKARLICKLCKHELDQSSKADWLAGGKWVSSTASDIRGFYINQLYSCTITPMDLSVSYLEAQLSASAEQEFFNSKLGLPHITSGAQVTDADLDIALQPYTRVPGRMVVMGVDVGKRLHYEITEYQDYDRYHPEMSVAHVLEYGTCDDFEELDALMHKYKVRACVIDANPETRLAIQFTQRFYKYAFICYYNHGLNSREMTLTDHTVAVNRTCWLDLSLARFKNKSITFPESSYEREYRSNLKAPVRIVKADQYGNPFAFYDECNKADHFAHARNYSEIAAAIVGGVGGPLDTTIC